MGIRASVEGLNRVEDARKQRGWKCQDARWYIAASVTVSVLKRFRAREEVGKESFISLCKAVGIDDWQEITDCPVEETEAPIASCSTNLPVLDPNFVGREEAIAELNTLVSQRKKVILIQAEGGVGKTTLAYRYLKTQGFDIVLELWMAKERQNITSVESVVEEWLKRYFDEEPGREFGVSLERLRCKLGDGSKKIGVLIDNLEPTLKNGRFIEAHRRYAELLRMLANPTVQSVTLITSRERLYEDGISVWLYPLRELPKEAWNQFFETCGINTGSSALSDASALYQMHQAYGGNAEAMFVLSGAIQIECQGDLEAYWEENREDLLINPTLENLVKSQLNKLQQDDEQAYRLLCRLGCYRYQDVPSVPKEGIFYLLWDVPEEKRKRVVKALHDRSLVKVCNEEYYLHPVIRAEAIERLRANVDWEAASRKAAEFWTESVETVETTEDARRALEGYYHYLEINNFELACSVLIKERNNKWDKGEPLGCSFYRLGILRQMIANIEQIIKNIQSSYLLSRNYNILGDLYWKIGKPKKGLECHKISGRVARQAIECGDKLEDIEVNLNQLYTVSFLNRGLCKLDLWELKDALKIFNNFKLLAETNNFCDYVEDSYYCLSLTYSFIGSMEEASNFAKKGEISLSLIRSNAWSTGYSLLFLGLTYKNLGKTESSFEMYRRAISFAEESHYTQVQAKALTGLAELYREQGDLETALSHHSESIELLDKIGAKCDLAEAYYQLGLTYQKMDEAQKSQKNFDEAIRLFIEMEAPKQVEKVQQAMENGG